MFFSDVKRSRILCYLSEDQASYLESLDDEDQDAAPYATKCETRGKNDPALSITHTNTKKGLTSIYSLFYVDKLIYLHLVKRYRKNGALVPHSGKLSYDRMRIPFMPH